MLPIIIRESSTRICYHIGVMYRSSGMRIFAWTVLMVINGDAAHGLPGSNAIALVNSQAVLDCHYTILESSSWTHTTDGTSNPSVIAVGCSVIGNNATFYKTEQPGGNICRLIIRNATMQQAGVYECYAGLSGVTYRNLVTVIDPVANAVVYNKSEVVEGDQLNVSCSINYNGPSSPAPSLRPLPYFTTPTGQNFTSAIHNPSANLVIVVATVQVQKPTVPIFQCNTVFEITGNTVNYNATPPSDNIPLGSTTELDVQFGPSTPNITSWIEVMITKDGACDVIVLNCTSSGNPTPDYKWLDVQGSLKGEQHNLTSTDVNLNYTCEAYNTIRNRIQSSSSTCKLPATDNSTNNSYCTSDTTHADANPTDLLTTIVLAAVLGGYGLLNIIATIAFLVYYNHKSNTMNDENDMSTFKNKAKLNARFPWLQRMLPCMNDCRGNAFCTFLWVKLFIWMSILTGIIVFPILVSMVNCSRKRKNSKGDSDIGMRKVDIDDNQEYTRSSVTPSTAAHGDIENPYETVGTTRFHPVMSPEDTTSAKNNNSKDLKKVFYTKVNPNFNSGEEIERYSVSTP